MPPVPRPAALAALALLLSAAPAPAVILKLTPLKEVLDGEQLILVARVESVAPDKPLAVFVAGQKLKGDAVPFDRMPVNLTGDAEAKKDNHTQVLLDRLAPGREMVVFVSKRGKRYSAFCFLEGTWFQMQGTPDDDAKTVRWAFLHCEPYLRRTFKGTTAELRKVVEDGLAKKADPPPPNPKEPPGYGPPAVKKCGAEDGEESATGARASGSDCPLPTAHSPLLGVIPSAVLLGPLAALAALFPGVAARMAVGMKRWRAFLVVASVNSTLAVIYFFARDAQVLPEWAVFRPAGFTLLLLVSTAVGLCWAGRRYRRIAGEDPQATATPTRADLYALGGLTLALAAVVASTRLFGPWSTALEPPMREFTFIGVGLLAATLYTGYRMLTPRADAGPDGAPPLVRLSLSGETVGLATLFLCGLVTVTAAGGADRVKLVAPGDGRIKLTDTKVYELPDAHQVLSGVTVDGDRLYLGAMKKTSFHQGGFVFCVDRHTGRVVWRFDNGEGLLPVFCTPVVADGRVYVGEGLHEDKRCNLYCLDAGTGAPAWEKPYETTSHTEGNPRVVDGKVYFTAGDDGLICADAKTGAKVWQLEGVARKLHIDGPPAVAGGKVFAGSGLHDLVLLGLDASTGKEVWRTPAPHRSFGPPLALGERVVYGLGTGNLAYDTFKYDEEKDRPAEPEPAGAVVCVAADTGKVVWTYALTRSVHTALAADELYVYATSRDGCVHCLNRKTGKLRWKTPVGATVTAGPAVAADDDGFPVAVYAVSTEGTVACLDPHTGRPYWVKDLREHTGKLVEEVTSTPAVVADGKKRTVYVGGMVKNPNNQARTAAVFRFDDEVGD